MTATPATTQPTTPARWPAALRLGIVVAWLAVYGSHIADWAGSALGLIPQRDPATVVEAHLNSRYLYTILLHDEPVGTLTSAIGYANEGGVYRQDLLINLDRADVIPGAAALIAQVADPSQPVQLELRTTADYLYRLRSLRVAGQIGDLRGLLEGGVDHKGFRGRGRVPMLSIDRRISFPALGLTESHGAVGLVALPAGLRPGESFVVSTTSFQAAPPGLIDIESTYRVGQPAVCPLLPERDDLLPVDVLRDGEPLITLWGDQRGVVCAATSATMPLAIRIDAAYREEDENVAPEQADDPTTGPATDAGSEQSVPLEPARREAQP